MDKFGISIDDWSAITQIFKSEERIQEIVLFGSRAKGNYKPGSDIDLAMKGSELTLTNLIDISTMLDGLDLPYKFDLVLFERIQEPKLTEHIERVGITIFNRKLL
jgi:predicted nucleotidyltransferase